MDLLLEYTKDVDELLLQLANAKDPEEKIYLEDQIRMTMCLFSLKMDFRRDAMELSKEAIEEFLAKDSQGEP